jgi:hypothetical protein
MPAKFNSFQTSPLSPHDYIVGYANTSPGGERRYTVAQIAEAVAGVQTRGAAIQESQKVFKHLEGRHGSNPTVTWLDTQLSHQLVVATNNPGIRIEASIAAASTSNHHAAMFRVERTIITANGLFQEAIVENALGIVETGRDYTPCAASANGWVNNARYSVGVNTRIDVIDPLQVPAGTAVRYTIQWWGWGNDIWYMINHNSNNPAAAGSPFVARAVSSITLTELAS